MPSYVTVSAERHSKLERMDNGPQGYVCSCEQSSSETKRQRGDVAYSLDISESSNEGEGADDINRFASAGAKKWQRPLASYPTIRTKRESPCMIQEVQFNTAEELWETLSPTHDIFGDGRDRDLMYRGQRDSSMKLIPSVLRDDDPSRKLWGEKPSARVQVFLELDALQTFAEYSDNAGIRIPNDSVEFRKILDVSNQSKYTTCPHSWPGSGFFEIMAMAQHYGVNTRLLDWTRNPYIATYFAASSAVMSFMDSQEDTTLAIWVKDINISHRDIRIIRPAGSVSERSAAQHSLFTVHPHSRKQGESVQTLGLDEMPEFHHSNSLFKLIAPVRESIRLLELSEKIGINAASIYPGGEGVGRATVEHFHRHLLRNRLSFW